jgi:CubicO group peptidase (beta-lactamase class C family)
MTHFAKQLLCIAIVGFLAVVPVTNGEAYSKPGGVVSRKDATDRQDAKISGDQTSKIDAAVTAFRAQLSIPGISVAIVRDNQIVFRRGYGLADLENQVPATVATVFRIASVTKSLTAVAAMQLAEKGKLDLDAPIQKYAPSFPTKAFAITTRQLLAHLSGVRNYKSGEGERTNRYQSLTDALAVFKDDPLEDEPGTKYSYTTYGYTLLGVVIEGASGMSYPEYLREQVLKPAGMLNTQVDDVFKIISNRARGYSPRVYGQFNGDWRNPTLMDSSYKIPGGGLVSTAEDLARFAIAVQNGVLIKPETFEQMSKSQRSRDGRETGYGYGWYVDRREGREPDGSVWHGGVQAGFTSDLWILPNKHFAVVILTNLEGGGRLGLGRLANQIADIVLR